MVEEVPNPEPGGASQKVVMWHGERAAVIELSDDAPVDGPMQDQRVCNLDRVVCGGLEVRANIRCRKAHPVVLGGLDDRVGILVDRDIEHRAAILVAIRRHIGAAASQTQTQRCAGTDDHGTDTTLCQLSGLIAHP